MKTKTLFLSLLAISVFTVVANAQDSKQTSVLSATSAYRFYDDIDSFSINVPTVVEIPFAIDSVERFEFAVFDKNENSFEPYYFKKEAMVNEIPITAVADLNNDNPAKMIDKNTRTSTKFILPENTQGTARITLSGSSPITSSSLTILLDDNVALPNFIEIRAFVDGQNRIVVAKSRINRRTINFPQTTSNTWQITFNYGQPLYISELRLNQNNITKSSNHAIRFLAQPGHSYRVYFDPDRSSEISVGESGNLAMAQEVFMIPGTISSYLNNPDYVIADIDGDGIPDIRDNCVSVSNPNQQDINNNGRGDACDDFDHDGVINSQDNCPDNPNLRQTDTDNDGIGDACDDQESRITERSPWIPWAGIGFAAIVLVILLFITVRSTYIEKKDDNCQ